MPQPLPILAITGARGWVGRSLARYACRHGWRVRGLVRQPSASALEIGDEAPFELGGEIAAWIAEHCFELLDAPVLRCASLDTPIPFNMELEQNFMAKGRLGGVVQKLLSY